MVRYVSKLHLVIENSSAKKNSSGFFFSISVTIDSIKQHDLSITRELHLGSFRAAGATRSRLYHTQTPSIAEYTREDSNRAVNPQPVDRARSPSVEIETIHLSVKSRE